MAQQNLVSASLSAEAKAEIVKDLAEIKKRLGFLTSLGKKEVKTLFKAGNGYAPLLDKAYQTVSDNPDIMPKVFSLEEFRKDYQLYKDLAPIASQIEQLSDSLQNTMIALASDTLMPTLEIYQAVMQNRNKVAGLGAVADDMQVFSTRQRKKESVEAKA